MDRDEGQQPFATPGEALEHYGIKGMRWGVRKEYDATGRFVGVEEKPPKPIRPGKDDGKTPSQVAEHNAQTKTYLAELAKPSEPLTKAEAQAKLAENQAKSARKLLPSEPDKPGSTSIKDKWNNLSPGQKKAIIYGGSTVAVYAAMVGAGMYAGKKLEANQLATIGIDPKHGLSQIDDLAGKPIDPKRFYGLVGLSQGKTWMSGSPPGYLTDHAFSRPAFELPAGHIFHRLSTTAEEGFRDATYVTHSADDFARYVSGFRQEKGLAANFHHITWTTDSPVKVPDLTTVLGQMSEVLKDEGKSHGPKETMNAYNALSGGGWSNSRSASLISRLKAQGFGALVDEMDAGVIGETPLVFFDNQKASPKRSVPLSAEAMRNIESTLKEINKPPGRKY